MTNIECLQLAIGTTPLVILFIDSEPVILIKRFLGFKEEIYDKMSKVKQFIHRMLYCTICSGFWIGLTVGLSYLGLTYQSLMIAGTVAILSDLLHNKLNE